MSDGLTQADRTILLASECQYLADKLLDALSPAERTFDCGHHWVFDDDIEDWFCHDDAVMHCNTCWVAS